MILTRGLDLLLIILEALEDLRSPPQTTTCYKKSMYDLMYICQSLRLLWMENVDLTDRLTATLQNEVAGRHVVQIGKDLVAFVEEENLCMAF
jgi:hypothetical protein